MATTKANNSEYQKSLAQYIAVCDYAREVFDRFVVCPDELDVPMSAAQVYKHLSKFKIFLKEDIDRDKTTTITGTGYEVCVTAVSIFDTVASFEKLLKIKPADKVTFMHEYAPEAKDIFGVCTLPTAMKEMTVCCAKDELSPQLNGVYLDFDENMAVACDGHIMRTALLQDARIVHGEKLGAIIPADFAKRHAGQEVLVCGEYGKDDKGNEWSRLEYAYCGKERVKLIEGRYPNWKSVIPKYNNAQMITIGDAWPQMRDAIKSLSKVHSTVSVQGKTGENVLTLSSRNADTGVKQSMQIPVPVPVAFDFIIGMAGDDVTRIGTVTTLSVLDDTRAILWVNGLVDDAKEVTLVMPRLLKEDDGLFAWSTQERADKYAKAKAKNDGKVETPKPQPKKKAEVSPILKQYADLKAKHPDAILMFRTGDFYETYKEDAKVCADILGITLTKSTKQTDEEGKPLQMAGFPYHALDTYLPKLIRAGKRVAICDQLEAPKPKGKKGSMEVKEMVSPGVAETPTTEAPAPVKEEVCAKPASKGSEALIDGKWVPVTVLTTNGTRAMVRKENGQRAIVKLEDIRGNIVDNTADAPSATPAPEPVCEAPTEAPAPETPAPVTEEPTPEAIAAEVGTKYADEKVYIATYSEKSFILTGATKKYRKELKKYGSWYGKKEGWILSNKRREFVEKLIGENLVSAAA